MAHRQKLLKMKATDALTILVISCGLMACELEPQKTDALQDDISSTKDQSGSAKNLTCQFRQLNSFDNTPDLTPQSLLGIQRQRPWSAASDNNGNLFVIGTGTIANPFSSDSWIVRRMNSNGFWATVDSASQFATADENPSALGVIIDDDRVSVIGTLRDSYYVRESRDAGRTWQSVDALNYSRKVAAVLKHKTLTGLRPGVPYISETTLASDGSFLRRIDTLHEDFSKRTTIERSIDEVQWNEVYSVDTDSHLHSLLTRELVDYRDIGQGNVVVTMVETKWADPKVNGMRILLYETYRLYRLNLGTNTRTLVKEMGASVEHNNELNDRYKALKILPDDFGIPGYGPIYSTTISDGSTVFWRYADPFRNVSENGRWKTTIYGTRKVGLITKDFETWTELKSITSQHLFSDRRFYDNNPKSRMTPVYRSAATTADGQSLYMGYNTRGDGEEVWSVGTYRCAIK
ncbi:MAG: hypothetical protein IPJ84_15945 [Bdellovibrionales bacterium]|nr:hypothetical protein [Bdellovibrionales bacterium]